MAGAGLHVAVVGAIEDGDAGHVIIAAQVHDRDALRRAAGLADVDDAGAEYRAARRNNHHLFGAVDDPRRRHRPSLVGEHERPHATRAASLPRVVLQVGALAVAVRRDDEKLRLRLDDLEAADTVAGLQADATHAAGRARAGGDLAGAVAQRLPLLGDQDQLLVLLAVLDPGQLVAGLEVEGDQAVRAHHGKVLERRLLDLSLARGHEEEVILEVGRRQYGGYRLARVDADEIHHRQALGGAV